MGVRSSNTDRDGSKNKGFRSQSKNILLDGHLQKFFTSRLDGGIVGPNHQNLLTASGGTETESGGFKYHAFTTAGADTFVVTSGQLDNASVLVIGAGGSGAGGWGGSGGGGGGILWADGNYPLTPGTYPLTVGDGNTHSSQNVAGSDGEASVFNGVTPGTAPAGEGGKYGGPTNNAGGDAGSTSPTPVWTGYTGGEGGAPPVSPGGGGGGAGGNGSPAGEGGVGVRIPTFTDYGTPGPGGTGGYFSGGGGTAGESAGGYGGGTSTPGRPAALENTGGGGGSDSDGYPNTSSKGIIIIKYPV